MPDTAFIITILVIAAFLGGMAFGYVAGLTKGITLGERFSSKRPISPLSWIFALIGAVTFLLSSIGTAIYSTHFLANSTTSKAIVVELVKSQDNEGNASTHPRYSFTTRNGIEITGESSMITNPNVGDTVSIRYLTNAPEKSRIDTFENHWLLPIIFAAASLFLAALGFILRWWRSKEQQWVNEHLSPHIKQTSLPTTNPPS